MNKSLLVFLLLLFGCTTTTAITPTPDTVVTTTPVPTEPPVVLTPSVAISPTANLVTKRIEPDQSVTLRIYNRLVFASYQISLTRIIEDSRCPEDVECFWAGEATLQFDGEETGTFTLTIGGGDFVDENSSVQIGDYLLTLEAVAPAPHSERNISQSDYEATLRLTTAEPSENVTYHFSGEQDGIAFQYVVTFRPQGDYDGFTYPHDHLLIDYKLENRQADDLVLFNRGSSDTPSDTITFVSPNQAGEIEIGQRAFSEPSDSDCPAREITLLPRANWLRAGAAMTGQLTLELPMERRHPFDDCLPLAALSLDAPLRVCLGFSTADSALAIDRHGYIDAPLDQLKNLIDTQQRLCSDTFSLQTITP